MTFCSNDFRNAVGEFEALIIAVGVLASSVATVAITAPMMMNIIEAAGAGPLSQSDKLALDGIFLSALLVQAATTAGLWYATDKIAYGAKPTPTI